MLCGSLSTICRGICGAASACPPGWISLGATPSRLGSVTVKTATRCERTMNQSFLLSPPDCELRGKFTQPGVSKHTLERICLDHKCSTAHLSPYKSKVCPAFLFPYFT